MEYFILSIVLLAALIYCFWLNHLIVRQSMANQRLNIMLKVEKEWIQNLQKGRQIYHFFEANNIKRVAILGFNEFCGLLADEVANELDYLCCVVDEHKGLSLVPGIDTLGIDDFVKINRRIDMVIDINSMDNIFSNDTKELLFKINKPMPDVKMVTIDKLVYYASEL